MAVIESAIATATPADCAGLVGELERLKALAWGRIMSGAGPAHQPSPEEELLTIPEVAPRLKVSEYRAYELARQGKLRAVKIGKSVRVTPSAIQEFVAQRNGGKAA